MDQLDILKSPEGYVGQNLHLSPKWKANAQRLCWEYNQVPPDQPDRRHAILQELFGDCSDLTFIEPTFHCDYGFNIHTYGLTVINYNCVILDTSPVHIGAGAFIAPGVCLACAGHSVDGAQRSEGIGTSGPHYPGRKCLDWCQRGGVRRRHHWQGLCDRCRQRGHP